MKLNFAIILAGLLSFAAVQAIPVGQRVTIDGRINEEYNRAPHTKRDLFDDYYLESEAEKRLAKTGGGGGGSTPKPDPPPKRDLFDDYDLESEAEKRLQTSVGGGGSGLRMKPPRKRDLSDDYLLESEAEKRQQISPTAGIARKLPPAAVASKSPGGANAARLNVLPKRDLSEDGYFESEAERRQAVTVDGAGNNPPLGRLQPGKRDVSADDYYLEDEAFRRQANRNSAGAGGGSGGPKSDPPRRRDLSDGNLDTDEVELRQAVTVDGAGNNPPLGRLQPGKRDVSADNDYLEISEAEKRQSEGRTGGGGGGGGGGLRQPQHPRDLSENDSYYLETSEAEKRQSASKTGGGGGPGPGPPPSPQPRDLFENDQYLENEAEKRQSATRNGGSDEGPGAEKP